MPNSIKYKAGNLAGSLQKGNVALGVNSSVLGPTSSTGWYSGITPPQGQYIIYKVSEGSLPRMYQPLNDAELIRFARSEGATGADIASAAAVLSWIATQPNLMAANFQYEDIVTDGLILNLDAGFVGSYPTTNTTWYDLSSNGTNISIPNSNTYSGSTMNYIYNSSNVGALSSAGAYDNTMECWFYVPSGGSYQGCCQTIFGTYWFRTFLIGQGLYTMIGFWTGETYTYQHPAFTISYDNWHCAVGVRRDNRYIIWINGIEVYNNSFGSGMSLYDAVGSWSISDNSHPNVKVAIARMYNRGLTDQELLQNYNTQKSRFGL
jgi:hypothetical protein